MPAGRKDYRDRLFNFIFGSEAHPEWTLSLYNAVNHTSYTDPSLIELTTIRETLYLGMHNDVSFLIASLMNLYEQQSSYNPNMPVRLLQYAGNMYERYIVGHRKNKYGRTLIQLPVPKLVVFYNGPDERPEAEDLNLSDAFPPELRAASDIQVRVRMLNVNLGKSETLLETCKPLAEYAWIVDAIRKNERALKGKVDDGILLETAIDRAIDTIPGDFIIKQYLETHRAEVKGMLLTEYNEAQAMELFREEGRAEGRVEGRAEGEDRLARLMKLLFGQRRFEDAQRAATDAAFRDQLYREFQIA